MAWLDGWLYRAEMRILGSSGGELTDFQVDVSVEYDPDKMRSDFGDIRFTGADGSTQLYYHLAEKVDGDTALFVVKIPSIAQSPSETTIYMYTGNSNATTTSDPNNVYIIFDDFSGEDNWNDLGGGEHSISEGQLILSDNGSEGVVYHDTSIPNDIEFKFIVDSASASYWADSIIYHNGSTIQYGYMFGFHYSDSSVWKGTGSYTLISGGWGFGSCCDIVRIVRFGTKLQAYKNDVKKLDITDSTFSSGGKIAFRQLIGRDKVIDEVSVRKRAFYPPGSIEIIGWETSVVEDSDDLLGQIEIAYYNIDLIGLIVVQQNTNNNLHGFLCVQHPYHELLGSLAVRLVLDTDLWAYLYVPPYIKRYKSAHLEGEVTVEGLGPHQDLKGEMMVGEITRMIIPVKGRVLRDGPGADPTQPGMDQDVDEKIVIMIGDGMYV